MTLPPRSDESSALAESSPLAASLGAPGEMQPEPPKPLEPMRVIAVGESWSRPHPTTADGPLASEAPERPPSQPPRTSSLPPRPASSPPPASLPPRSRSSPPLSRSSFPPRPPSVPPRQPLSLPPPPSFAPPPPVPRFDEPASTAAEFLAHEPAPLAESPGEPEVSFSYEEGVDLDFGETRLSDPDLEITALESSDPPPRPSAPPPPLRLRSLPPPPPPSLSPAQPSQRPASFTASIAPPSKRPRPWWEDLFGDDFVRTLEPLTPVQVLRETTFIEESLGIEAGGTVLDLACGTGRHAVELASRGYNVVGYDLSPTMLARAAEEAEERRQAVELLQGDMREMSFESSFDGVYCWASSFGYFDEEKNAHVARLVHRALRRGGRFLLDIVNRDFIAAQQPRLVWFEGDGCVCIDETNIDFITSRLKVKRTVMLEDGRSRELDYSIRLYALHELGRLLHEIGFRVIEVSGHPAIPGVFFGPDSPRIIVLAEKA